MKSIQVNARFVATLALVAVGLIVNGLGAAELTAVRPPNIVLILADDLGYGELGRYGQKVIETPRLDRLADEGMRFTQFYAGSTVCAPSRCVLMTGRHTGHARVRGNGRTDITSLRKGDVTLAEVLKQAGYATAICGKWGLGDVGPNNQGRPNDQGFDYFFGYINQTHAHNYFPDYLWRNAYRVPLPNVQMKDGPRPPGGVASKKVAYSADSITDEALKFVEQHRDQPFFLYWPMTLPHANNEARKVNGNGAEVPDLGIYANRDWPEPDKGHAAMITRLDADVGRLLDLLDRLGIADNTLVLSTSDNGPHHESGQNTARFDPNGPLRGMKRDLYEGGIRVPLIARWPKVIPDGSTSDYIGYFGDFFATFAELSNQPLPARMDSVSILPTLTSKNDRQRQHDYLYWEFYEKGSKQAVRAQKWKAIRIPMLAGKTELYNLDTDLGETTNVASQQPDVVRRLESLMDQAHIDDPNWHR